MVIKLSTVSADGSNKTSPVPCSQSKNATLVALCSWLNLLYAVLCFAGAWAIWFFWQQNED
jgi:hypothetical protein